LHVLQRQLACDPLSSDLPREKRYPYLDLGLLEFIFAAPREHLVRPGHRRSLMRRTLVDIVPEEILNRKRKAYIARSPLAAISADWTRYSELTRHMASGSLGVVDTKKFLQALQKAFRGQAVSTVAILRTLGIERWLRCTTLQNVIEPPGHSLSDGPPTLADLFAEQK
jgi:asparagine synthase (glutamine-hydrolysing)